MLSVSLIPVFEDAYEYISSEFEVRSGCYRRSFLGLVHIKAIELHIKSKKRRMKMNGKRWRKRTFAAVY